MIFKWLQSWLVIVVDWKIAVLVVFFLSKIVICLHKDHKRGKREGKKAGKQEGGEAGREGRHLEGRKKERKERWVWDRRKEKGEKKRKWETSKEEKAQVPSKGTTREALTQFSVQCSPHLSYTRSGQEMVSLLFFCLLPFCLSESKENKQQKQTQKASNSSNNCSSSLVSLFPKETAKILRCCWNDWQVNVLFI